MNREAWRPVVQGVTKESDTTERLTNNNTNIILNKHIAISTTQHLLSECWSQINSNEFQDKFFLLSKLLLLALGILGGQIDLDKLVLTIQIHYPNSGAEIIG